MRRPFAAALTAAALAALLTGCSTDRSGDTGAAPAPGTSAGAAAAPSAAGAASGAPDGGAPAAGASAAAGAEGDAALSGNTAAICAQAAKTGIDFAATFAGNVKLQIDAASAGEPAAVQQAEQKATRDVQNYAYALRDMSELAADAKLKKALADMSKQVEAFKGDISKIEEKDMAGLRAKLDEACGTK